MQPVSCVSLNPKYVESGKILTSFIIRSLASLWQGNVKKSRTFMKVADIEREIFHIFWTTWGISMTFLGKMWLMIILKATKIQAFTLSLEDTILKKLQVGVKLTAPSPAVLGLNKKFKQKLKVEETTPACTLMCQIVESVALQNK